MPLARLCLGLALVASVAARFFAPNTVTLKTIADRPVDRCVHDLFASVAAGSQAGTGDCATTRAGGEAFHKQRSPASNVLIVLPSTRDIGPTQVSELVITGSGFLAGFTGTGANLFALGKMDGEWAAGACVDMNTAAVPTTTADGRSTASATATDDSTLKITNIPADWNSEARELEAAPRPLCVYAESAAGGGAGGWIYTGVMIGTAWECDTDANRPCSDITAKAFATNPTTVQQQSLKARTTCCKGTGVGVCYNPSIQSCCGNNVYEQAYEKCCSASKTNIQFASQQCQCDDTLATAAESAAYCPNGEACCSHTKFSELATLRSGQGVCYDGVRNKCCNTGEVYDSTTQQCCSVNGVQAKNMACPCHSDAHCATGEVSTAGAAVVDGNMRCCRQTEPALADYVFADKAGNVPTCSVYNNFPSALASNPSRPSKNMEPAYGSGDARFTRCTGTCIDIRYQICCNGNSCIQEYEKCCNATCCNKFVGTCAEGFGAASENNAANFMAYQQRFLTCTTVEAVTPLVAVLVYVVPTVFLVIALGGLALAVVFAGKSTSRSYSFIERGLMVLSTLAVILSCGFFFSPAFKYGLVSVLVSLVAFLAGATRSKKLNAFSVATLFLLLLYIFDPFHGNFYFTLASDRNSAGFADRETAGVLHTVNYLYKTQFGSAQVNTARCTSYYVGYFSLDANLRDTTRYENPSESTFGYCSRAYVLTLLLLSAVLAILVMLLFVLALLGLVLRFRKEELAPIELEIAQQQ